MSSKIFNDLAKSYDSSERIELANVIGKELKKALVNVKNKTMIDYGSGTGLVGLQLIELVKETLFIDSSEEMNTLLKYKIDKLKLKNTDILLADFSQEIPNISADIVIVSLALLHIPNTQKILQSFFSILNDNGKLIIVDFDKNENIQHDKVHNGFTHEELKNELCNIGFKDTQIKTFYYGERIFMKKDASMFISVSQK